MPRMQSEVEFIIHSPPAGGCVSSMFGCRGDCVALSGSSLLPSSCFSLFSGLLLDLLGVSLWPLLPALLPSSLPVPVVVVSVESTGSNRVSLSFVVMGRSASRRVCPKCQGPLDAGSRARYSSSCRSETQSPSPSSPLGRSSRPRRSRPSATSIASRVSAGGLNSDCSGPATLLSDGWLLQAHGRGRAMPTACRVISKSGPRGRPPLPLPLRLASVGPLCPLPPPVRRAPSRPLQFQSASIQFRFLPSPRRRLARHPRRRVFRRTFEPFQSSGSFRPLAPLCSPIRWLPPRMRTGGRPIIGAHGCRLPPLSCMFLGSRAAEETHRSLPRLL